MYPLRLKIGSRCEYVDSCKLYDNESHSCTKASGERCGEHRSRKQKESKQPKVLPSFCPKRTRGICTRPEPCVECIAKNLDLEVKA
jgi:hypothetical protein